MNPMMMELLPLVHQGYCCSQLLLLLMLQAQDRQNPGVVRAAQGLCQFSKSRRTTLFCHAIRNAYEC